MSHPLSQHLVSFYGDELVAVQQPDSTIYTLFARLCENLGLGRESQVRRIHRHAVLREGLITLTIETAGGPQQAQALKLALLPLWLSGVHVDRVKPELREKLTRYQREAADVLWQAFKSQILTERHTDDLTISTDAELVQLQQIAEMGRAIVRMAEEQIELRRRMDSAARAFQGMRHDLADVQVRLGVLEERVSTSSAIIDVQAAEVSNRVKALAELLTVKDNSKNHYQAIFGELYRRFSVSSYKLIQQTQYEAVLTFLDEWRTSIDTK